MIEEMVGQTAYCADISLKAGEPLIGTATQTDGYLLVEYNGGWGEKALVESGIPEAVKDRLKGISKISPTVKVLLIRSDRPFRQAGIRFFVAATGESDPAVYGFHMAGYENLLDLDIQAILRRDPSYQAYRRNEPMILVCTNGRRDACCARLGVPTYSALMSSTQDSAETVVWHTTHIGGHRFAANMIVLPHGLLYGRVGLKEAVDILAAYRNGIMVLENLRGRTCYAPPVQVAEQYLRARVGLRGLDELSLRSAQETQPGRWEVQFAAREGVQTFNVGVRVEVSERTVFDSCRMDKATPIIDYTIEYSQD